MKRHEDEFYKVIGYNKETREVIMLDYIFEHEDGFKGATGSSFEMITPEQLEYYQTPEYVGEYLESAGVLKDYDDEVETEIVRELCDEYILRENFDSDEEYENNVETFMDENLPNHIDNKNDEIIDSWIVGCDGEYVSQDPSYIGNITEEDTEKLSKAFDIEIETYSCIGGGRMFDENTFNENFVSFDDDAVAKIKAIEGL